MNKVTPRIGIRPTIDGRRNGIRESLEDQTMNMAKAAAELLSTLRYPDGRNVECVIADTTIGGVAEAAACEAKFTAANVTATLTVTPCWCYGSETMDMNPLTQKAVWGFNGTERPGAVYLAAVLAAHAQKGLPAFGIYGHDVQDADDTTIPDDVREKILRFGRAAVAAGWMRGKSYLSMGSVSMGIAGSIVPPDFFEDYLNMRCESVDCAEFLRRMDEGIYDKAEYKKARAWVSKNLKQGPDVYNGKAGKTAAQHKEDWDFVTNINYTGYYLCCKYAARVMALQNSASGLWSDIVQVNSKSGLVGSNRNGAYAGSKFGTIGLTQSFALELVADKIKVNSVCPGNFFDGPLWSDPVKGLFVQYLQSGKVPGATNVAQVKEHYEKQIPMHRGCLPTDVAKAIIYCAVQQYETGQAIPVSGGQVMLN